VDFSWRWVSSGMWWHASWYINIIISDVFTVCLLGLISSEDSGSMYLVLPNCCIRITRFPNIPAHRNLQYGCPCVPMMSTVESGPKLFFFFRNLCKFVVPLNIIFFLKLFLHKFQLGMNENCPGRTSFTLSLLTITRVWAWHLFLSCPFSDSVIGCL